MSSDAKRASNARYLAKFKTVSVRFTQTDAVAVQSAADSAGESLNAYIVGAVAQRMEWDASSAPQSPAGALPPEGEEYAGVRQWTRHRGAQQPLDEWKQKRQ